MRFLLDVNVLVALAHQEHAEHARVGKWFASMIGSQERLLTCPITEIGFVRVSIQAGLEPDAQGAVETLQGIKASSSLPFDFLIDDHQADQLPGFVQGARQVTDGHLLALAQAHSSSLATLDMGIPGGFLLP